MKELFHNPPDLPTPLNSQGGFSLGSGGFKVQRKLKRKKSDPVYQESPRHRSGSSSSVSENATDRYLGSFSVDSKRHVWDLLAKHPKFDDSGGLRLNRVRNNTSEVLKNDPVKTPLNGGFTVYQKPTSNDSNLPGPRLLFERGN